MVLWFHKLLNIAQTKLIYLAAYLIPNGKTQVDYSKLDVGGVLKPYVTRYPETQSHTLQPEIYKEGLYHDCDDNILKLAKLLLSHEPVESGITALQLSDEKFGSVRRFYIECTEDKAVTPFIQQMMYKETLCEKVYQIPTSHSPFFSQPQMLSNLFVEIAGLWVYKCHFNASNKELIEINDKTKWIKSCCFVQKNSPRDI